MNDFPVHAELVGVALTFRTHSGVVQAGPTVRLLTTDYKALLADPGVDVIYCALPHNLHEQVYLDIVKAGKDLLAEKPFGIDLAAAENIVAAVDSSGCFVRCSSEFPFLPGTQRVVDFARSDKLGIPIQVVCAFHHSSDLDPSKAINWKRQTQFCGQIGVMGDLGMHVAHVPLRLGWKPKRVYAQLQQIYTERPDGKGGVAPCDTWDNALLHLDVDINGKDTPMRWETKRLAPGETDSWSIEILGTDGGIRFSTKQPKTLWTFQRNRGTGAQEWFQEDLGFEVPFKTITGGISRSVSPMSCSKCGPASLPNARGNSRDASVAPPRRRRWQATKFLPLPWSRSKPPAPCHFDPPPPWNARVSSPQAASSSIM